MRVLKVNTNPTLYSSNVYLILGDFNKIEDVNTLIDTGGDGYIINEIKSLNTGVGKTPVAQIILTHNHFDHSGGLKELKNNFNTKVLAVTNGEYVDKLLKNNDAVKIGDDYCEIIHISEHSNDSICIYCYNQHILFSGDTPLFITSDNETHSKDFLHKIEYICSLKIDIIYPGHGNPVFNPQNILNETYKNVKKGIIF